LKFNPQGEVPSGSRIPGPQARQPSCREQRRGRPELGSAFEGRRKKPHLQAHPITAVAAQPAPLHGAGEGKWGALGHWSCRYSVSFIFPLLHRHSSVQHSCSCLRFGLQIDFRFEPMSMFRTYASENKGVWKRQNSAQCYLNFSQGKRLHLLL